MTLQTDNETDATDPPAPRGPSSPQAGGAVYGLGLIGALIWFWRQSDGVGGRITAVLKALVWPAFLVYGAFKALQRDRS